MTESKTKPIEVSIESFLATVSDARRKEATTIIDIMKTITGEKAVMWGPSIIGFGSVHYKYDTGREGDMPLLGFSPRKASITIYFSEGFDRYAKELGRLGKYKQSVSCLYINKLSDVDMGVLRSMLKESHAVNEVQAKPTTVDEYVATVPQSAQSTFTALRNLVKTTIPKSEEVYSYGIIGYKIDSSRARVFVSGWKDHVAVYPVPKDAALKEELAPYIKGKGTLWFSLDKPLPEDIIRRVVLSLTE